MEYAETLFRFARAAARAGNRAEARRLLWAALRLTPEKPDLWVWLAAVAPSSRARLAYLGQALALDPHNRRAKAGIVQTKQELSKTSSVEIPEREPISFKAPVKRLNPWPITVFFVLAVAVLVASFPIMSALAAGNLLVSPMPYVVDPATSATPSTKYTPVLPATWTLTPSTTPSATPSSTATRMPTATATTIPEIPSPTWIPTSYSPPPLPVDEETRWIDVDLSEQLLIAYEGETPVRWVVVSTGLPATPTVVGRFRIYVKYLSTSMSGPNYYLPDVPYVLYFYKGFGLHGTYWHSNFGSPMSHGCVNLPTTEAAWLYDFTSIGTLVNIHY